jgi:hypothetical protein
MNINSDKYIKRFNENLAIYNNTNNTNYTFEDVQNLFVDCKQLPEIGNDYCMCGHIIKECYEIVNPNTNHKMILGSSCINTYMINSSMKCIDCNKRFKMITKSKYCNDCKPIKKSCRDCKQIMTIKKSQKEYINTCYNCIMQYQNSRGLNIS